MTHFGVAGSEKLQQLVYFGLFKSYFPYFECGGAVYTAYSVLRKPMSFFIFRILTKSRKPQIFSLRLRRDSKSAGTVPYENSEYRDIFCRKDKKHLRRQ